LFISLNCIEAPNHDPSPTVLNFLQKEERMCRELDIAMYKEINFVQNFFRETGALWGLWILFNCLCHVLEIYCSIWGSHSNSYREYNLLKCNAMHSNWKSQMLCRNVLPLSSGLKTELSKKAARSRWQAFRDTDAL
jgi:hypothetical protein